MFCCHLLYNSESVLNLSTNYKMEKENSSCGVIVRQIHVGSLWHTVKNSVMPWQGGSAGGFSHAPKRVWEATDPCFSLSL